MKTYIPPKISVTELLKSNLLFIASGEVEDFNEDIEWE